MHAIGTMHSEDPVRRLHKFVHKNSDADNDHLRQLVS